VHAVAGTVCSSGGRNILKSKLNMLELCTSLEDALSSKYARRCSRELKSDEFKPAPLCVSLPYVCCKNFQILSGFAATVLRVQFHGGLCSVACSVSSIACLTARHILWEYQRLIHT
jgi:hypothetical protein